MNINENYIWINFKTRTCFVFSFFVCYATPDRYAFLPSADCQLKFCRLQLYLLDDFRIRLFQIKKQVTAEEKNLVENKKYIAILNTVAFMVEFLKKWSEDPVCSSLCIVVCWDALQCIEMHCDALQRIVSLITSGSCDNVPPQFYVRLSYHKNRTEGMDLCQGTEELEGLRSVDRQQEEQTEGKSADEVCSSVCCIHLCVVVIIVNICTFFFFSLVTL